MATRQKVLTAAHVAYRQICRVAKRHEWDVRLWSALCSGPDNRAVSDQSQGPGWWQASDGKWYPPGPQLLLAGSPTTERNAITLATISAVAAVLGVFLFFVFIPPLVAIVCGFAALKNFDRNGGPAAARWLATLAVFVGSLELLLAVFFIFVVGMYMNDMNDAGFAEPWATSEALRLTEFVLDRIPSGF